MDDEWRMMNGWMINEMRSDLDVSAEGVGESGDGSSNAVGIEECGHFSSDSDDISRCGVWNQEEIDDVTSGGGSAGNSPRLLEEIHDVLVLIVQLLHLREALLQLPNESRIHHRLLRHSRSLSGCARSGKAEGHIEDAVDLVSSDQGAGCHGVRRPHRALNPGLTRRLSPADRPHALVVELALGVAEIAVLLEIGRTHHGDGVANDDALGAGEVELSVIGHAVLRALEGVRSADAAPCIVIAGLALRVSDGSIHLAFSSTAVGCLAAGDHAGVTEAVPEAPGVAGATAVLSHPAEETLVLEVAGAVLVAVETEAGVSGRTFGVAEQADLLPAAGALADGHSRSPSVRVPPAEGAIAVKDGVLGQDCCCQQQKQCDFMHQLQLLFASFYLLAFILWKKFAIVLLGGNAEKIQLSIGNDGYFPVRMQIFLLGYYQLLWFSWILPLVYNGKRQEQQNERKQPRERQRRGSLASWGRGEDWHQREGRTISRLTDEAAEKEGRRKLGSF